MSESLKLPYGLRNGKIIHISEIPEAQRGLKCGCVCPVCHEPLQARIGSKRVKHFAHNSDCPTAVETALHMMAKDIVLNNRQILLPHVEFACDIIRPSKYFKYTRAEAEVALKGIKPDLMISDGKNTLYIEIVVTHDVDEEKYDKIKEMNISVLKIDLEEYYYTSLLEGTYKHLENQIIHQKDDLERQKQVLELYCAKQGWSFELISDLGSGMNYNKKGLQKLLDGILDDSIGRLVITHKDRLLRFGAELVFSICEAKHVDVVIINSGDESQSFEEELAQDVLEIITVFSAKLYGSRSKKNKKLLSEMKQVAEAAMTNTER